MEEVRENTEKDGAGEIIAAMTGGILSWYPFEEGKRLLFAGQENAPLRAELVKRGLTEAADEDGLYDYIIGDHLIETSGNPAQTLASFRALLKPEGHLLLICENRFALKSFAGDADKYTGRPFDGLEDYAGFTRRDFDSYGGRCYSRSEILDFLMEAGLGKRRGYSILPHLLMPQLFFAWDYEPAETLEIRTEGLYSSPESVFLDERAVYRGLIKNNMFHQMANAYLIDCSEGELLQVKSVTISADRGRERSMATLCFEDRVIKKPLYPEGNSGIEELIFNHEQLRKRGIQTLELKKIRAGSFEGQDISGLQMSFITHPIALGYLRELIFKDRQAFIELTELFLNRILQSSDRLSKESEEGPLYERVYVDMVPLNAFYRDGDFIFFDQEFVLKEAPVAITLVRCLGMIYMGDRAMEEIVPQSYFLEKYGLQKKYSAIAAMGDNYINRLRKREILRNFDKAHRADSEVMGAGRLRLSHGHREYKRLFQDIFKGIGERKLYIFGSGSWGRLFINRYGDVLDIRGVLDNNEKKAGGLLEGIKIMQPSEISGLPAASIRVIICIKNFPPVKKQLEDMGMECRIYDPRADIDEVPLRELMERKRTAGAKNAPVPSNSAAVPGTDPAVAPESKGKLRVGYVAGVFDLFHMGHLNILKRARQNCDYLMVGVVSDAQARAGKKRSPYIQEEERREIVAACRYVDEAFVLPLGRSDSRDVFLRHPFDVQFSGSDYEKDPEWLKKREWLLERGAELIFFPYTESVSSSSLKERMEKDKEKG